MADKPKLKYKIIPARNPGTGAALLRPVITGRETLATDQVVEYALKAGYVRGQFHDMRGALNGFIEAIQQLGRDGKSVNLSDWLRIHGELTGSVDSTRQLGAKNGYKVVISPLKELKRSVSDFSWTNVDEPTESVKVDHVYAAGSSADGVVEKSKRIVVNGRNLAYDAALGDAVSIAWTDAEGEAQNAALTPVESDAYRMAFEWPVSLSELESGAALTLTFTLHGGVKDSPAQVVVKKLTLG